MGSRDLCNFGGIEYLFDLENVDPELLSTRQCEEEKFEPVTAGKLSSIINILQEVGFGTVTHKPGRLLCFINDT
jgi:hypothetical protein